MFLLVNFYWKIIKSWNFTGKTSFKIRFTKFHNFFFYEFQLMIKECLKGHIFVTVTNDEERKMGWEDINGIKGGFQHPSCKLHRWSTHQTLHLKGSNHTRPSSPIRGPHNRVCPLQELRGPPLQLPRQGSTGPKHGPKTITCT